ncbi:SusC/RagA family TonB-linked outer membrane protein [Foetidibacter luteolus]|uniref:SusC/RagA family TonB-linked outer membrane protein n=1 Tax=Foetidibacter luteolus TaxID=2608880 RepID=UPI00129A3839|nr:TonB-dependent receptor [Foetidibacter luteolus]
MRICLPNRKNVCFSHVFSCDKLRLFFLIFFLTVSSSLFAQTTVTGKVSSGDSVLANVTVQVKGTSTATQTNDQGRYTISAPANGTLVFTNVGYGTLEVKIDNRSSIDVNLQATSGQLGEVVVIGYGVQKKATLTGSVSAVKGSELIKSPATNVSNSLAGRLPGLVSVTPSSEPGYDGSVLRIRGVNTLNNNNPLVVVDGVPGRSLDRIDPSTIENISVLKDASAAIYGAQAANGVILITTKRGKTGKPTVTASFNQGWGRPTVLPKMADAVTYATMVNEIAKYAGRTAVYSDEDLKKYADGSSPWTHPNTDWFHEVLKPWSGQNYGNVSVNGGGEAVKYFISLSRRSQDGFYYNSGTKYNQYDIRSNLDATINKYISIAVDISGRNEDRNFPVRGAGDIFRMVMRGKPNATAYWPNGTPGPDIEYGDNPVVVSTKATGYDHDKRYVLNSNAKVVVKVPWVSGLSLTGNAALDKGFRFHKRWRTPWYLYSFDGFDENGQPKLTRSKKGFANPDLFEEMEDNQNTLLNGLVSYEKKIGTHYINVLAGAEKIEGKGDNFNAYRKDFASPSVDQLWAGPINTDLSNGGSSFTNARLNYFGRVNYNYKEKYLAEFVWRYQGSYIFEEATRFGFFPGISLGYKISEENFFRDNVSFINSLKIRGSWGRTGNDQIPEWQYLALYNQNSVPFVTNNSLQNPALFENVVPNKAVSWEIADQANIGFDATLLNNRLSITADYFNYTRSNILWERGATVPLSAGMRLPRENIGKMANKGFDFSIDYKNKGGAFTYQIGLNGGYQKNKIVEWAEPETSPDYMHQRLTGYPIYSGLYFNAIGVFKDQAAVDKYPHVTGARAGDIIFEDYNGDGVIDDKDRIRMTKSDIPRFTGGLTFSAGYKGFDLSLLIQGATGAVRYINTESGEIGNFLQSFAENRWTEENPNAKGPRTYNRGNEYWVSRGNTYWLYKTDYIRLKNIELGYNLPSSLLRKASIQNLRIYVNAFNFLTYAPHLKDFDPESGANNANVDARNNSISTSGTGYPIQKIINTGISVTF